MLKKDLYKIFISSSLAILCMLFMSNNTYVHAENVKKAPLKIILEVNDLESAQTIKEVIINNNTNYILHPFLIDNIDYVNSTISMDNVDITKTGTHNSVATVKIATVNPLDSKQLFNKVITENVTVEIVDTTAPIIAIENEVVNLRYNQVFDANNYITSLNDNSLEAEIILQIESNVDTSVAGEYSVTYSAYDSSLNEAKSQIIVNVAEEVNYSNYGTDADKINEMLTLINEYRDENGLSAYELGSADAQTAIGVRACEAIGDTSHKRPDGSHYKTAFDDYNVDYKNNPYEILTYFGKSVEDKLSWWQSSPGHNRFLLNVESEKIAIGYCDSMWAAIVYE